MDIKGQYQRQWVYQAAVLIVLGSAALLTPSRATVSFFASCLMVAALGGYIPEAFGVNRYGVLSKVRLVLIATSAVLAAVCNRGNLVMLVMSAAALLWLLGMTMFVRLFAKQKRAPIKVLPYVQFLGDLWVILLLAFLGINWWTIGSVTVLASSLAALQDTTGDKRLLAIIAITTFGIFVGGMPPMARGFGIYLTVIIWIAVLHVSLMDAKSRSQSAITVSASDG